MSTASLLLANLELRVDFDYESFKAETARKEYEEHQTQTTVKFYTADSKVFTKSYPSNSMISYIKETLVELFNLPSNCIELLHREQTIPDDVKLNKFKADKFGILEIKLISNDRAVKIHVEDAYKGLTVPDILTVRIANEGNDEINEIVVEVENQAIEKPYIGGYKDVRTGIQYHHGFTQTGPPEPKLGSEMKNHRDTQTYDMRNRITEKEYDRATQMHNKEIYITNVCDKIITARAYESAEDREKRLDIEAKVRTIQRYFRAWKMRLALKQLSAEYHKRLQMEREREERERLEDEQRRKKDLIGKVFPMKSEDFAMLYNMVERWKKSEIERICMYYCGAAKITEFYLLLDKEVEILQSIERLRLKVNKDLETKNIVEFFKAIGNPLHWESDYKQIPISMDTLETQKGREYFALYQKLCNKDATKTQRIQGYIDIKGYLKSHSCNESNEIVRLIDRACELLARGMDEKNLRNLHKRIEALVYHHFKLTECNEGVTDHINKTKVQKMMKDLMYCQSCRRLKPIEAFTLHARLETVRMCSACKWLDNAEEPRIDLSPYKFILKQIRNYERLHQGTSSIAFILQGRDIYFITTYIWHGHSALSENNDIYDLRLVRWEKNKEWSPWNCILLTTEEAKCHLRMDDLKEIYEEEFMSHVFNKHALAKKHFPQLLEYDRHFSEFARTDRRLHDASSYYNLPQKEKCLENIE